MASANDILRVAKAEIGNKEYPSGSNNVKYNTDYYGRPVNGSAYPWCCAFVWWVFKHANASNLFYDGQQTAYCPTLYWWFNGKGKLFKSDFKPGDIVFFDFNSDGQAVAGHVGILEKINPDGSLLCVEGNTSKTSNDNGGSVMQRTRQMNTVLGVGRPDYSASDGGSGYTKETVVSNVGSKGITRQVFDADPETNITLLIQHNNTVFIPNVKDGITWETERSGVPGKLTFTVIKDSILGSLGGFQEGDPVKLTVNGTDVFYGFVFKKSRSTEAEITVTAYDQLRYLKNKDTIVYENKTASQFIQMIANDFNLNCGELEDTETVFESRVEEDKTLFDMIQTALDSTLTSTKKLFVLYDDVGKLTLKNIENLKLNLLVDEDTGNSYEYTSSIDDDTYNKVKLTYDNEQTGTREIYVAQNGSHINQWGVLQYFEKADDPTGLTEKANTLLKLYDQKTRHLTIKKALGDVRVRAGCALMIKLNLGDITTNNYMVVEKVKHTFNANEHTMDLTMIGGEFIV